MKQYIFAGLATATLTGGLIGCAPPASGCQYTGLAVVGKCDGSVQPDGTWQRRVEFQPTYINTPTSGNNYSAPIYTAPDKRCDVMGPDLHPWVFAFNDPPTHIDD